MLVNFKQLFKIVKNFTGYEINLIYLKDKFVKQ